MNDEMSSAQIAKVADKVAVLISAECPNGVPGEFNLHDAYNVLVVVVGSLIASAVSDPNDRGITANAFYANLLHRLKRENARDRAARMV